MESAETVEGKIMSTLNNIKQFFEKHHILSRFKKWLSQTFLLLKKWLSQAFLLLRKWLSQAFLLLKKWLSNLNLNYKLETAFSSLKGSLWSETASVSCIIISIAIAALAYWQWDWFAEGSSNGETFRNIALIIIGVWIIYGIIIAARRTKALEKQIAFQEQAQITERYARAVEQLSSNKLSMRMIAISTLKSSITQNYDDRIFQDILKSFCAYIRESAPAPLADQDNANIPLPYWEKEDIREILKFLTSQLTADRVKKSVDCISDISDIIDLSNTNLRDALFKNAHLEGVNFMNAYLEEASFYGAHLEGALLNGAHLEGVIFVSAHLEGAIFSNAHLENTRFDGAKTERAKYLETATGLETVKRPTREIKEILKKKKKRTKRTKRTK